MQTQTVSSNQHNWRLATVLEAAGIGRSTLYRLVAKWEFPLPRQLSPRRVAWNPVEVTNWIDSRPKAAR